MAATIIDVATEARVSTATVSRFLRGERVRTAERVALAIERLGYQPAVAARSLRSGVHYAIAMIVRDITNSYFAALAKGVESVFRATPYRIFLCNTDESTATEDAVLHEVMRRVDGIILAPAAEQEETPLQVRKKGMPIVLVDRELSDKVFDSVLVDNGGGAAAAARYLLDLDHTEIAMISGPLLNTPGQARYKGFLDELSRAGVKPPRQFLRVANFKETGGYDAMRRLLALPRPPTAVFCANNVMTVGGLKALAEMRVAVPGQISVIGFDDLDLATLLNPPLSVIDRPSEEQGAIAARLLLKRLTDGTDDSLERMVMPTHLVVRASCGAPREGGLRLADPAPGDGPYAPAPPLPGKQASRRTHL